MEQEVALEVRQAEREHEKMELGNLELVVIMK